MSSVPPFSLDKPRYDQSSYWGRVRHFLGVVDPMTLFASEQRILESVKLLDDFKNNQRDPSVTDEQLWEAKKLTGAVIHPDTKENIFLPFRMSAFVPMNVPIVLGMITAPTTAAQLGWQVINQSYNVGVNYANRNASLALSTSDIFKAYSLAVISSCTVAGFMSQVNKKLNTFNLPPVVRAFSQGFVPFAGVFVAGTLNLYLVRRKEMDEGISVTDSQGRVVGTSKIAGSKAFLQTATCRAAIGFCVCMLPPLIESQTLKIPPIQRAVAANPKLLIPVQIGIVTSCLWLALPLAFALFPQIGSANVKELEPEFHNLKDESGKDIEEVFYNKGL